MYSTARFTLVNPVEKNVEHLVRHRREFVATPRKNPVRRHFVQCAEEYLRDDVRLQISAKDAGALSLFECRTNQREILSETSRRKLLHKLGRAAQFNLENDCQIAIGAEPFEMQRRDLAQFLLWIRYVFDPFPCGVECFFNAAIEDRMEDVFLAFEIGRASC